MPRRNNGPRLRWDNPRRPAKNPVWWIVWSEHGRSCERSTGATDLADAQVALGEFLRQQPVQLGPRDPSEILITDILADYCLQRAAALRDSVRLGCAVEALTPFWEGRRVQDVTKATCAAYERSRGRYFVRWMEAGSLHVRCVFTSNKAQAQRELEALRARRRAAKLPLVELELEFRPLKPGTIRRELTVLRAAINWAHQEGRITRTVAVELPAPPPARERFLNRVEAARLIKAARQDPRARLHLPLFILISLYTGRRKEAVLSLRWPAVDLRPGGLIDFRRPGEAETTKRRGRVKIPPRLMAHLRNARKRGTDLGHVVNDGGAPIRDVKRSFQTACARAGLDGVTPHTLRHTCATWLMDRGVDKWKAAGYLAMSMDTLERVYGHHHPDADGGAGATFSQRTRNVRATGGVSDSKIRVVGGKDVE